MALSLASCTVQASYPTTLVVSGEFSVEEKQALVTAASKWQALGSSLRITYGEVHSVDLEWDLTPVHKADLSAVHAMGRTDDLGVRLDVIRLERNWGLLGLQKGATHEFGHVLGLGPPADEKEHVHALGDVMCPDSLCVQVGDGELSAGDVAAWVSGGSR